MTIFEEIRNIIANVLSVPEDDVTPDSTFASLEADCFDRVDIFMAIEDRFDLIIPDKEIENFDTVSDIITYLINLNC